MFNLKQDFNPILIQVKYQFKLVLFYLNKINFNNQILYNNKQYNYKISKIYHNKMKKLTILTDRDIKVL